MINSIPITKARINLGELIRRVYRNKEYFILEKGGIPVAGILDIEAFEDWLEMEDSQLKEQIRKGYEEYKKGEVTSLDKFLIKMRSPKE